MPRPSSLQREIRQTRPFRSAAEEASLGIVRTAALVRRAVARVVEPSGITPAQDNVLRILPAARPAAPPTPPPPPPPAAPAGRAPRPPPPPPPPRGNPRGPPACSTSSRSRATFAARAPRPIAA